MGVGYGPAVTYAGLFRSRQKLAGISYAGGEGTNGRDAIERNRPPVHHKWVSGALSTHDKKLRIQFYNKKMYDQTDKREAFICERKQPKWNEMLAELFEPGKGSTMERDHLKMPARVLLLFMVRNVMPRRGDKRKVRLWDIPILYCLIKEDISPFTCRNLSRFGFGFKRTERYLKLKHEVTKKKWKMLRPDARPLAPGEQDEASSGDALKIIHTPMVGGFLEKRQYVEQARPEGFEQQRRDTRSVYDRNEHEHKVHAYNEQIEINQRFLDDRQQRMHAMWRQGEEVVFHPPYVDYSSLPPFDGSASYPVPSVHHSQWVDPYQQQAQSQQGQDTSSSTRTFNFSGWMDTMKGLFGDQQPPCY
ncbi:hypothetical protein E3N88_05385 [Mikania micrantha]|uniref:Uncharacterized protein n=1 Tax=Mikania micrantha TaxID=192012 RepID=A0A5N6PNS9_9ASTR|nr:hypothetical protein E3N88_05385 [Mikania micrantha]